MLKYLLDTEHLSLLERGNAVLQTRLGNEPVGTVRVRWFQSFAMPERLAVIQRFRGHKIGQVLIERCRALAESRGCNMLYAQVLPADVKHWENQGWRRLIAEAASSGPKPIVAMVRAVDPSKPLPEVEAPEKVNALLRAFFAE